MLPAGQEHMELHIIGSLANLQRMAGMQTDLKSDYRITPTHPAIAELSKDTNNTFGHITSEERHIKCSRTTSNTWNTSAQLITSRYKNFALPIPCGMRAISCSDHTEHPQGNFYMQKMSTTIQTDQPCNTARLDDWRMHPRRYPSAQELVIDTTNYYSQQWGGGVTRRGQSGC